MDSGLVETVVTPGGIGGDLGLECVVDLMGLVSESLPGHLELGVELVCDHVGVVFDPNQWGSLKSHQTYLARLGCPLTRFVVAQSFTINSPSASSPLSYVAPAILGKRIDRWNDCALRV